MEQSCVGAGGWSEELEWEELEWEELDEGRRLRGRVVVREWERVWEKRVEREEVKRVELELKNACRIWENMEWEERSGLVAWKVHVELELGYVLAEEEWLTQ